MPLSIVLLLLLVVVLPSVIIRTVWRQHPPDRFSWLITTVTSGAFLLYTLVVGRWDWVSFYLRYLFTFLFVIAAIRSYRTAAARPFLDSSRGGWRRHAGTLLAVLFIFALLAWAVSGFFYQGAPVQLRFPLAGGWYYVAQGGNSPLVNYHNSFEPQQYAVDIVALNSFGARARGLYPDALDRYRIYGTEVISPCDGTVLETVDGLPDQIPPASDTENAAGNHVTIACAGVEIVLAHLLPKSILVAKGETVTSGQPIGRVGNSGNTTEPHLHVHAVRAGSGGVRDGVGVPIEFDGKFPVRNTTF